MKSINVSTRKRKVHIKGDLQHNIIIHNFDEFMNLINNAHRFEVYDNYGQKIPYRTFYRGECREYDAPNVAGIYRSKNKGSSIYHAYMRRFYDKFNGMNNFSKLSYMQHYGLHTCLLDVTTNAFVALFFSCLNYKDKDKDDANGVVHIILPKRANINNYLYSSVKNNIRRYIVYNGYSDTVEILATLSLLKDKTRLYILKKIKDMNNFLKNKNHVDIYNAFYKLYVNGKSKLIYIIDWKKEWKKLNQKLIRKHTHKLNFISFIYQVMMMKNSYKKLYRTYQFRNFLHKIRQDTNDFEPVINFYKLLKPKIIQPAINNIRMEVQKGYFIFEPFSSKTTSKDISKQIQDNFDVVNIIIPRKIKLKMLNKIDDLGINRATLFPDYSNVAQYINYKFNHYK